MTPLLRRACIRPIGEVKSVLAARRSTGSTKRGLYWWQVASHPARTRVHCHPTHLLDCLSFSLLLCLCPVPTHSFPARTSRVGEDKSERRRWYTVCGKETMEHTQHQQHCLQSMCCHKSKLSLHHVSGNGISERKHGPKTLEDQLGALPHCMLQCASCCHAGIYDTHMLALLTPRTPPLAPLSPASAVSIAAKDWGRNTFITGCRLGYTKGW